MWLGTVPREVQSHENSVERKSPRFSVIQNVQNRVEKFIAPDCPEGN